MTSKNIDRVSHKLLLILLFVLTIIFIINSNLKIYDPEINQKQAISSKDLKALKDATVAFYLKNKKFPSTLKELSPEFISAIPKDPWGNEYIITSLAWRTKGSGIDILSGGSDGKIGGKGDKIDIITRIDLSEIGKTAN